MHVMDDQTPYEVPRERKIHPNGALSSVPNLFKDSGHYNFHLYLENLLEAIFDQSTRILIGTRQEWGNGREESQNQWLGTGKSGGGGKVIAWKQVGSKGIYKIKPRNQPVVVTAIGGPTKPTSGRSSRKTSRSSCITTRPMRIKIQYHPWASAYV